MEVELLQIQPGCLIFFFLVCPAVPDDIQFPIAFQTVRIELGKRNFNIKRPVSELRGDISVGFDLVIAGGQPPERLGVISSAAVHNDLDIFRSGGIDSPCLMLVLKDLTAALYSATARATHLILRKQ